MDVRRYELRWTHHQSTVVAEVGSLYRDAALVDVTLACEDQRTYQAHKLVLSACSQYFQVRIQLPFKSLNTLAKILFNIISECKLLLPRIMRLFENRSIFFFFTSIFSISWWTPLITCPLNILWQRIYTPQGLFSRHSAHQHPIIFLKDVSGDECEALLTYMYRGEVSVSHDQIHRILRVANSLQVRSNLPFVLQQVY